MKYSILKLKLLLIATLFSNVFTQITIASELIAFHSIQDAISNGEKINFVIESAKCNLDGNKPSDEVLSSFIPDSIIVIKNKKITATNLHFTLNNPSHNNSPIYEYIKYDLASNGKFTLDLTLLSSITMEPLVYQSTLTCTLGAGLRIFNLN